MNSDSTLRSSSYSPMVVGTALGVVSALGYTGTNIALRQMADPGDFSWAMWVACMKALPSALAAWVLVARGLWRGERVLPPRQIVLMLLAMGLFMQFGGNGLFQWSLSLAGLAITVPLTFSTLICSGAWFSRVYLGEPITPRVAVSMLLLMGAIALLSVGAPQAVTGGAGRLSSGVGAAVAAACLSGVAFGTSGVLMRHCITRSVPLGSIVAVLTTTGVIGLGGLAAAQLGPAAILERSSGQWPVLWTAGILNGVAFFAVSEAFRRIPVTRVNLLNASQTAMCTVAGVLLFAEPVTLWLFAGTVLTVAGLVVLGGRVKFPRRIQPADADVLRRSAEPFIQPVLAVEHLAAADEDSRGRS